MNGRIKGRVAHVAVVRFSLLACLVWTFVWTPAAVAEASPSVSGQQPSGQQPSGQQTPQGNHLVGVRARLDKSLDAGKVKIGDVVVAKPEAKVHLPNGVDLATNSRLVGRVDTVQPSVAHGNSAVSVTFDKVQLKDGQQLPIKATILWIGAPPNQLDPAMVSAPADRTTPGVGVETGGSVGGNLVPVIQGGQGAEITGGPVHHRGASAVVSSLPEGLSAQTNAVPGVNFFSDVGRSDSGWFRSKGSNVFVPSGTVLALAVVVLSHGGTAP